MCSYSLEGMRLNSCGDINGWWLYSVSIAGIIYRDLKPENILLQEDGHIVLTDFDLSFLTSSKPHVSREQALKTKSILVFCLCIYSSSVYCVISPYGTNRMCSYTSHLSGEFTIFHLHDICSGEQIVFHVSMT